MICFSCWTQVTFAMIASPCITQSCLSVVKYTEDNLVSLLKPCKSLIFIWRDVKSSPFPQLGGNLCTVKRESKRTRGSALICVPVGFQSSCDQWVDRMCTWNVESRSLSLIQQSVAGLDSYKSDLCGSHWCWSVVIHVNLFCWIAVHCGGLLNDLPRKIYNFGSSSSRNKVNLLIWRNVTLRAGLYDAVNLTYCFFKTY